MDLRGAVKEALGAALGGGAGAADAFAVERLGTRTTVRKGALETAHESATRGVGVRAFRDGRMGMACTTDLTEEGLRGAGARAADIARMAGEDTAAGLPAAEHRGVLAPPEGLDDPGFDSFDPAAGVEMARASEAAAFSLDARITNSQGATFHSSRSLVALASSDGFEGSFRRTRFGLSVVVAAAEGGGVNQRAHWWTASPRLGGLDDPEEVGREAARRCLRRLGWRKIPTCRVPVVFAPEAAAELAAHVADACKGSALFRGASFLADSLGKEVASPLLTLVDDPTLPGRLGTVAFDGEGVLPRRKAILEGGVLRSFLFDSYSLRRLAAEAPGRAAGGAPGNAGRGISGSTIVGTSNLFFEAGSLDPGEVIGGVREGLYVDGSMGHGVNVTTGDYSVGATGCRIRDGRLDHAVQEVTIAGDLRSMLRDVDAVGNDLVLRDEVSAPTIRVSRMTVSGR